MGGTGLVRFLKELRRRRVFRVAGLYVVGAWLLLQAANILFPGWGVPTEAIRFLFWAVLLGFPVALVFGWVFDISSEGIRRTLPVGSEDELLRSLPLRRADYAILAAFFVVVGAIIYDTTGRVMQTATVDEWRPSMAEVDPHAVAVLPFTDLSPERDQEYFTDGISEEILNRLSSFRDLKVIARTSSFAFKDSGYDITRISGLLAVNYLLQGSVRRDGQRLRISAQLVDRTGVQVWNSNFDRELTDIFQLQDEIAEAVARSIVPQIVPPVPADRLPDFEAFQAYLAGRELVARRPAGWVVASLEHLSRAIEVDPEFAEPYAERAIALGLRSTWAEDPEPLREQAGQDVDRALALRPDLARAYTAKALLMDLRDRTGTHAEREALLTRSLVLDPNQVDALNWLSATLLYQGRRAESEEMLERAARLDPLAPSINVNIASGELQRGAVLEAERRLLRLLEVPKPSGVVYFALVGLYAQTGRLLEALAVQERRSLDEALAMGRASGFGRRIYLFATLGMRERAEYWRDRNRAASPESIMDRMEEIAILSLETGLMDYADALAEVEALIAGGLDLDRARPEAAAIYGELLTLSGRYEAALAVLEPMLASGRAEFEVGNRVRMALAWAHLQQGRPEFAIELVEPLQRRFRETDLEGRLHLSGGQGSALGGGLAGYAMVTRLSGDLPAALKILERAEAAGWRGYYGARRDPRWDQVRGHPKFEAILARVKADLDDQRARLEATDADGQFVARLEEALASHADAASAARP